MLALNSTNVQIPGKLRQQQHQCLGEVAKDRSKKEGHVMRETLTFLEEKKCI